MPAGRVAWGVVLAAAGALEVYGIRNSDSNDTLSEFTRWAFAVDHPAGRIVFGIVWIGFAGWFLVHILKRAAEASSGSSR